MPSEQKEQSPESTPKSNRWIAPAACACVIALAIGIFYSISRTQKLEDEVKQLTASVAADFSNFRRASADNAEKTATELRQELQEARDQATAAVGQAKSEAQRRADRLNKELSESIDTAQQKQKEEYASELNVVKQAADQTDQKVSHVMTQVQTVSTDVDKTKSDLQQTISELKSVVGDMGVQSGLVATNAKEIAALRALGERNYYEFDLKKSPKPTKVGDVQVRLKSADPKRSKYTLVVLADDKQIEKQNRTVNEPIQFYLSKMRQPSEIVVNEVSKDHVVGYLTTPKVQQAMR